MLRISIFCLVKENNIIISIDSANALDKIYYYFMIKTLNGAETEEILFTS